MITVLYDGDPDGFGAAYAASVGLQGRDTRFINLEDHHDRNTLPEIPEGTTILYILDYSFPPEKLRGLGYSVTVIDHHKTTWEMFSAWYNEGCQSCNDKKGSIKDLGYAQQMTKGRVKLVYAVDKSAALLTWLYMNPGQDVPQILAHISDRDLWFFKLDGTEEICLGLDAKLSDGFEVLEHVDVSTLRMYGNWIKKYQNVLVEDAAKSFIEQVSTNGVKYGLTNISSMKIVSKAHHRALELHPEWQFTVSYFIQGDEKVIFSLRSRMGEYDVGSLAKSLGGGGHRSSSGFVTTFKDFEGLQI